jgi:hyperosmotically inducible periplasmic protein
VRGRRIDVTTGDGIVTLRGAVQSEQERRQAVALARNTDGVRDVRDELTIEPADRTDRESPATGPTAGDRPDADRDPADGRTVGDRVDDGWITIKIQSQLYLEQNVRGRNVEVETRDGVVTLRGHVASDAERRLAEQIARDTDGVRRVDNQIAIGQAAAPGDDR